MIVVYLHSEMPILHPISFDLDPDSTVQSGTIANTR